MEWIGDLERAFAAAIYPNRVLVGVLLLGAVVGLAWLAARRRWDLAVRRNPRRSAAILVPALAIALPLGWYLGSPLVLSSTLDEPAPVVAGRPTAVPSSTPAPPTRSPGDPSPTPLITPSPSPILLERAGKFRGADDFHFGRGTARLIETEPGTFVVRLEGFEVRNGPDLYVYLSRDADGYTKTAIELGKLKADKGNQNYEVPAGADVTAARSVVIWCKQFSVLFAAAKLAG